MTTPEYCQHCSWLFDQMGACQPPGVSIFFSYVSLIPYLIFFIFLGLGITSKNPRQIKMAILLLSAYLIGDRVIKNIVQSPRPSGACKKSFGFPSSHMVVICCYALEIWDQCRSTHKIFLLLLITLEAISRVILKYHTWEQVIGGIVFAIIYTLVFNKIYGRMQKTAAFQKIAKVFGVHYPVPKKAEKQQ